MDNLVNWDGQSLCGGLETGKFTGSQVRWKSQRQADGYSSLVRAGGQPGMAGNPGIMAHRQVRNRQEDTQSALQRLPKPQHTIQTSAGVTD